MHPPASSRRSFLVGVLGIAPMSIVIGEDLTLFWPVLLVGLLSGGEALLRESFRLSHYARYSTIARCSFGLIGWSVVTFLCYPPFALVAGLPLDLGRALASVVVTLILSGFFFIGLRRSRWPAEHAALLMGMMTTGVIYIVYLGWVAVETGHITAPLSDELRATLNQASRTWPSRYPVVLLALVPVCVAFTSRRLHRLPMIATATLFAAVIVWSLTRGAWVGLGATALAFGLCRLRGWKVGLVLGALILVGAASLPVVQARYQLMFPKDGVFESSMAIRFAIWREAAVAVAQSPVFGYGQQGTGVVLTNIESELEVVSGAAAHNDYVDVAVRGGLPALGLYLGLVASVVLFALQLSGRPRREQFPAYVAVGLIGAFAYGFFHELLRQPVAGAIVWYFIGNLAHEQAAWNRHRTALRSVPTGERR